MKVDVESGFTTPHSKTSILSVLDSTPSVTPPISIESPVCTNMVPRDGHPVEETRRLSHFHFSPFPSISLLPSSALSSQPARIVETMVVGLILTEVAVEWGFTSSKVFSKHLLHCS